MKATLRMPTETSFAFIEIETEVESVEQAIEGYAQAMAQLKPQVGLSEKDFQVWLDNYLVNATGDAGKYAEMSPEQQNIIQNIKRATKRIKSRNGDNE